MAVAGLVGAAVVAFPMVAQADDADSGGAAGVSKWGTSGPVGNPDVESREFFAGDFARLFTSNGTETAVFGLTPEGHLELVENRGGANQGVAADIPSQVEEATIVDMSVSNNIAAAVDTDGNLHLWGSSRSPAVWPVSGSLGTYKLYTPDDLGGDAQSIGVGTTWGQVLLDDGTVGTFSSFGYEKLRLDADDSLVTTAVESFASSQSGFIQLEDGSMLRAGVASTGFAVPEPSASNERVERFYETYWITETGRVDGPDAGSATSGLDTSKISGRIVALVEPFSAGTSRLVLDSEGHVTYHALSEPDLGDVLVASLPQSVVDSDVRDLVNTGGRLYAALSPFDDDGSDPIGISTRPTVTGTAQVGQTLTGTPGTFSGDPDGVTNQWLADGQPIDDATGTTLELDAATEGAEITFASTATKSGAEPVTATSDPTDPVVPAVATEVANLTPPTITGTPEVGEALTASDGEWTPEEATLTREWLRDGTPIDGADGETYELVSADEGARISVRVTGTFDDLTPGTATSAETEPVAEETEPQPVVWTEEPSVDQAERFVGQTLTCTPGTFTGDIDPDFGVVHEWVDSIQSPLQVLGDATEPLVLTEENLGMRVQCRTVVLPVTTGRTQFRASPGPPLVTLSPLTIIGQPTITGQPFIGATLEVEPADVSDDRAEITFQWVAGDGEDFTPIEGATEETLELTEELRDQEVRVVQTASRSLDETSDSAESIAVGPITDAPEDLEIDTDAELTGTPRVGETLTGTPATFSPTEDVTVTNFWVIGDEEVEADGTELVLTDDHVGQNIQFKSVATRGEESLPSTSNTVGPVLVVLAATDAPTIEGTPQVGETLTGTPATFNDDEGVTVANRWLADGEPISGETGSSLELTADQVGQQITFESIATRGDDTASDVSDPVGPVELAPVSADEKPTISGDSQVGETLTGTPAEFSATEDVEVTNRWLADGEPIEGADGTELELTADLVGKEITFESTAKRGDEEPVVSESDPTDAVTPAGPSGSDDTEGGISAPDTFSPGDTITVTMSEDYAGQEVSVWLFSDPRELGTYTVTEDGTIRVEIPEDVELGEHQLTVYDESGDIIGWQAVTIVAPGGIGGIGGPGDAPGLGLGGALPNAGAPATLWLMIPLGLAFLLAGAAAMRMGRRQST